MPSRRAPYIIGMIVLLTACGPFRLPDPSNPAATATAPKQAATIQIIFTTITTTPQANAAASQVKATRTPRALPSPTPTTTADVTRPETQQFSPTAASRSASALCKDGSLSYSQHRRGTCSGHKGVKTWLVNLPP